MAKKEVKDKISPTINLPKQSDFIFSDITVVSSKDFQSKLKERENQLEFFGINSWNFQINSEHEHLFMSKEIVELSRTLIVIIDEAFMQSKRLESILEYLIVNEQENDIRLYFIRVGNTQLPNRVVNRLYESINSPDIDKIEEELKGIISEIRTL